MPRFLLVSIVASIVLTVALNVVLRLFPGAGQRVEEGLRRSVEPADWPADERAGSRVGLVFPWKLMLIGSLVLSVALNVLLRLVR